MWLTVFCWVALGRVLACAAASAAPALVPVPAGGWQEQRPRNGSGNVVSLDVERRRRAAC